MEKSQETEHIRTAIVVAIARNGVIGRDGGLAWRISDDLKWFKSVTLGKPIIMGRKTFDSIGKALPGRPNIVVTRNAEFSADGITVETSLEVAIETAKNLARQTGQDEICIIGGAEIYAASLASTDRMYLTRVDADVSGDVYFPQFDENEWRVDPAGDAQHGPKNDHNCRFFILDRGQPLA